MAQETQHRILAIHAHPDDESSKGAATMARYADEGHRVRVLTCTGGERGDILNPNILHVDDMIGTRQQEMAQAAEILGVEHEWLGYVDSGLPEGDPLQVVWAHLHGGHGVYPEVLLPLRRHRGPGAQGAARRGREAFRE